MGAHGEPGVSREKLTSSDELVAKMMDGVLADLPYQSGDEVVLVINGLGSTTMMELLIANRRCAQLLAAQDITVYGNHVGDFITTQEMAGFSITLMKLDEELKHYYDMPARSFGLTLKGAFHGTPTDSRTNAGDDPGRRGQHRSQHGKATQADQIIGDGDHGIGMARGFAAVAEAVGGETFATVDDLFKKTGMKLITSIGGAAGVIFGTLFTGGAKNMGGLTTFDSAALALLLSDGLAAIQTRGKANPGDKTMIDALAPAATQAKALAGEPLDAALAGAAEAAHEGMESTRDMVAKFGKAKALGERSLGHPDPGALSLYLILKAMADYTAGL